MLELRLRGMVPTRRVPRHAGRAPWPALVGRKHRMSRTARGMIHRRIDVPRRGGGARSCRRIATKLPAAGVANGWEQTNGSARSACRRHKIRRRGSRRHETSAAAVKSAASHVATPPIWPPPPPWPPPPCPKTATGASATRTTATDARQSPATRTKCEWSLMIDMRLNYLEERCSCGALSGWGRVGRRRRQGIAKKRIARAVPIPACHLHYSRFGESITVGTLKFRKFAAFAASRGDVRGVLALWRQACRHLTIAASSIRWASAIYADPSRSPPCEPPGMS